MEKIELLTKSDLEEFKKDLLQEIRILIQPRSPEGKKWLKSAEVRKLLNISPGKTTSMILKSANFRTKTNPSFSATL